MALTNESLESLSTFLEEFHHDKRDFVQQGIQYFAEAQNNSHYQIWANGTEFGAKFAENFENLRLIATDLHNTYEQVYKRLKTFYDIQVEINRTGKQ